VRADVAEQRALLVAAEDPARAHELHHEALAQRAEHGLRTEAIRSLELIAHLMATTERAVDAARLLAAADAARASVGVPRPPVDRPDHAGVVDGLRARLGAAEMDDATVAGRALALDDAIAFVRRARGERGRPTAGWESLTPTELDIVRCVVDGMSNPQIAEKLLMSRGTVKAHLGHVYAKLALRNRTELATYAAPRLDPAD
jgi:DNA-binding CsgD family transcriptional regulator